MTYTPKHLRPYKRPEYYIGPDYFDYYPVAGQSRDSDVIERSNFRVILDRLGGESDTVIVVRDAHWAVGWVETIYVARADEPRMIVADQLLARIADYPVLDENDLSELEYTVADEAWSHMALRDRVELCQTARVSVFAARHDYFPSDDNGIIREALVYE